MIAMFVGYSSKLEVYCNYYEFSILNATSVDMDSNTIKEIKKWMITFLKKLEL